MSAGEVARNGIIAALVAALVGGAARVIGLDGPHALALGCGVLAVVLALLAQRSAAPAVDLRLLDTDPPAGGRRDVDQLAWSMVEHRTHIRGVVLARVGAIAATRLAEHGLDPQRPEDAPAIEALLRAAAWAPIRPDRDRPVTPRALEATLRSLDRLPPPEPLGPDRTLHPDRTPRAD